MNSVFFHIYPINNYTEIILELLEYSNKLIPDSELYFLVSNGRDKIINMPFGTIIHHDGNNFEFDSLNYIRKHSLSNPNDKICYIHTKGVTTPGNKCIEDWRKYMAHFILKRYKDCIAHLDDNDTCGVDYHDLPFKHYSGNFWWANASYINTLPNPHDIPVVLTDRHKCENWICYNSVNNYNMFSSGIDVYQRHLVEYSPHNYT